MQRDTPDVTWSPTTDEREEFRRQADEAMRFIGGEVDGDGREFPWVGPVNGATYILVPPASDSRPWRDPTARIGSCIFHKECSPREPLASDPCAFRVNSYLAGPIPEHLYIALFLDWRAARPDMPQHLVWKSVKKWRIMRLRFNGVRVAYMTGRAAEHFLPGGEPMLRHSQTTWGFVRWVHTKQQAALAIIESDPAGSRIASRMLIFCHPADALCDIGALEATPTQIKARRWFGPGARGTDGRRLLPRLILPTPGRRPRIGRWYDGLTRAWAGHRRRKRRRQANRRVRWSAMREIAIRELALREENADIRFRTRVQLIATFKMAISALHSRKPLLRLLAALLATIGYAIFYVTQQHVL
jgi:hypothetical protein